MKFACEGCHAQYMISDEKVGPRGVKVRCKKCNHVNIVRRPAPATDPDAIERPAAPQRSEVSLDDELGAAFAQVTGTRPGPEKTPADEFHFDLGDGGLDDLERTRIVESPELQRIFAEREQAAPAPAPQPQTEEIPTASEWYLAIEDQQVGPLTFEAVRARWEAAEIGPDTLCWRSGMADWMPLAQVPELADALAPRPAAPASGDTGESSWLEAAMKPQEAPPSGWTPSAASALKDLVEAELQASRAAEPAPEATLERDLPAVESTSVRSLLKELPRAKAPEAELSRLLPLEGVPRTSPSSASSAPAAAGGKRGGAGRWVGIAAALALLAGGGAWAFGLVGTGGPLAPQQPPVAAAPVAPPEPAQPSAPAAQPAAPAAAPATNENGGAGESAVADAAPDGKGGTAVAEAPAEAQPAAPDKPDPVEETAEKVAAEAERQALAQVKEAPKQTAVAKRPVHRAPRRRREPPPPPPPPPAPTPTRASTSDLLDAAGNTSSIDSLFAREFEQKPAPKRSSGGGGYIPPAPGSGGKPHQLSQGDIAGVVVGHKAELKNCATRYKEASGQESGTVVMRWTIRPDGSTTGIRAVKGTEHAQLANCISGLVKGWKFPAYSGPQMAPIDFPFQF